MTKTFHTLIAAAALSATFTSDVTAASGAEGAQIGAMKPHHAMVLEIGNKRAVSYFLAKGDACKLVLTIAEEPNLFGVSRYEATRFEADVPAGQSTRYGDGIQAIDFSCHAGATAMSAKAVDQIATGSSEK